MVFVSIYNVTNFVTSSYGTNSKKENGSSEA